MAREGSQYDLVVASGGDGTLNEAITGLVQLEHPPLLGYLPQGSANDFASSLHISDDPAAAAEVIVQEHVQVLDVGFWNQRPFAYVASSVRSPAPPTPPPRPPKTRWDTSPISWRA
ncbi:MAG: acylglycerol kinase family protein [Dysosmobacter sp.]